MLKYEWKMWFAKLVGLMLIQSIKLWDLTTQNPKKVKLVQKRRETEAHAEAAKSTETYQPVGEGRWCTG